MWKSKSESPSIPGGRRRIIGAGDAGDGGSGSGVNGGSSGGFDRVGSNGLVRFLTYLFISVSVFVVVESVPPHAEGISDYESEIRYRGINDSTFVSRNGIKLRGRWVRELLALFAPCQMLLR